MPTERLYHAFPRPRKRRDEAAATLLTDEEVSFRVLELIFEHGLMCVPERLLLFPDPDTERGEKNRAFLEGRHYDYIEQSRACFTLLELEELTREIEVDSNVRSSHLDLFGNFAIGLDVLEARHIGILPTIYYYKDWPSGQDLTSKTLASGLSGQLINRLDEIRNILAILAHIEAIASDDPSLLFPSREKLSNMGIVPKFEAAVQSKLDRLTSIKAKEIFSFFDTDRVAGWNLVDFIKMLLSFYQTADSSLCDDPLTFFRQREWRLIHHMRKGLEWLCLGNGAPFADPSHYEYRQARNDIRSFLGSRLGTLNEDQMGNFWVLAKFENRPFREMIREVVVPKEHVNRASKLIMKFPYSGPTPEVKHWVPKWRLNITSQSIEKV